MGRLFKHKAFTLIELMVAIAVLTIAVSIPWMAFQTSGGLRRQADYRFALRNAQTILADLRQQNFDDLAPVMSIVSRDGTVTLPRQHLLPESVQVTSISGEQLKPSKILAEQGVLQLDSAHSGKKVIVNFAYKAVDTGECHRVDDQGQIRLENRPVVEVTQVLLAQGDQLTPLSPDDWTLEPQTGLIQLKPSLSGKAVAVDYIGQAVGNVVRGEFLTEELKPVSKPGAVKRIVVEETYGFGFRVRLSGLKVSP